jgi:hypothetical protein
MSQAPLTRDRSLLLLEGLWDQLASVIASVRSSEEQPSEPSGLQVAQSRVAAYRARLREVIVSLQYHGVYDRSAAIRRSVSVAMTEVLELLDDLQHETPANWTATLYRAQDSVLAVLHDLRHMPVDANFAINTETA